MCQPLVAPRRHFLRRALTGRATLAWSLAWSVACGGAQPSGATARATGAEATGKAMTGEQKPPTKADAPRDPPAATKAAPESKAEPESKAPPANDPTTATAEAGTPTAPTEEPVQLDIEFVPTPDNVVRKMLGVAKVTKHDVVYDLGCGDGRLVIAAAKKYGARGVGFDLDPVRVAEARANVEKAGVGHLVTIEQKNIFDVDLSPASVVTLYLLPSINVKLIPQLEKLAPGSRIISHDFGMEGVDYDDVWTVIAKHHRPPPPDREHYVYKWTTPLRRIATTPDPEPDAE